MILKPKVTSDTNSSKVIWFNTSFKSIMYTKNISSNVWHQLLLDSREITQYTCCL